MKRGEIWTVSGVGEYYGKPRPAVILQSDAFDYLKSVMLCGFTTDATAAPLFRPMVERNERNGLDRRSYIMVDKIQAVSRDKIGERIGKLDDEDIAHLDRAVTVILDLER